MTTPTKPLMINTTQSTTAPAPTPPGFNKSHRDLTKYLLIGTSLMLLMGRNGTATFLSALAIIVIKQGTMNSAKNLKWISLAVVSFLASTFGYAFMSGYALVDEEKAYELKMRLWFAGRCVDTVWGSTLALFLASALTKPGHTTQSDASSSQPNNFKKSQ